MDGRAQIPHCWGSDPDAEGTEPTLTAEAAEHDLHMPARLPTELTEPPKLLLKVQVANKGAQIQGVA